ncbi:ATP-grasp domain-containing protein [Roseimaritima ulvae]|nr:ATP-grasp domain-containing protein [Roseimaritima ulvae]
MRMFAAEFVCGGGFSRRDLSDVPTPLRREGVAMLRALAEDLSELGEVVVPLDSRIQVKLPRNVIPVPINGSQPLWPQWVAAARDCESAIIVAPEQGGTLAQAVSMLRAGGLEPTMSSGDFLRVASDKWETARTFAVNRVPHPPTYVCSTLGEADRSAATRWVVKPRDGCGTERISVFDCFDKAAAALTEGAILQGWSPGTPVSVGLIVVGGQMTLLPAVAQAIDSDSCSYAGGQGPLSDDLQRRVTSLASCALAAMPPTAKGFVGLDLILADQPSGDCVIEVNPRLTTSYVGLRHMVEGNLAARIIGHGNGPLRCSAEVSSVRWAPDGQVWVNDSLVDE